MLLGFYSSGRYTGPGTINGSTELQTGPNAFVPLGHCKVRIHEQASGHVVGVVWSDAGGAYVLPYVDPAYTYYAVAFDPAGQYDLAATRSLQVTTP